jgi:hypothetical protein
VYGNARVGPGTTIEGFVMLKDDADVEGVTISNPTRPGWVFAGDCYIRSDNDWFTDEDTKAPWPWTVYRTARTHGPSGRSIWQASAGCVTGVDLNTVTLDWHDEAGTHVNERARQLGRVRGEIARRGGFIGS